MTLWLALFGAVCCAYAVQAVLSARAGRSAGEVLLIIGGSTAVFAARALVGDSSTLGSLRGATLIPLVILIITGGRPPRIFDQRVKARTIRRMPKKEREAFYREDFKSGISQLALVLCIIVGVLVYQLMDLTFLD
jgi:hypothetical protein